MREEVKLRVWRGEVAAHPARSGQLSPKRLAERVGISTRSLNMALEAVGFIERIKVGQRYAARITEEGLEFGGYFTYTVYGRIEVYEPRWNPSVLDYLLL